MQRGGDLPRKGGLLARIQDPREASLFAPDAEPQVGRDEAHSRFLQNLKICNDCLLRDGATQPVPGVGPLDAPLMMVGEAPGAEEDRCGVPFSGPAGQLLTRSLSKIGVSRARVYITNVVRYRPPGNRMPHAAEILACGAHLVEEIDLIRPAILAPLGAVAAQALLGTKEGLKTLRGRYVEARGLRVFPMYHPAFALRNLERDPSILAVFETDLRRVCRDAGLAA